MPNCHIHKNALVVYKGEICPCCDEIAGLNADHKFMEEDQEKEIEGLKEQLKKAELLLEKHDYNS